jgi:hypothetical protein
VLSLASIKLIKRCSTPFSPPRKCSNNDIQLPAQTLSSWHPCAGSAQDNSTFANQNGLQVLLFEGAGAGDEGGSIASGDEASTLVQVRQQHDAGGAGEMHTGAPRVGKARSSSQHPAATQPGSCRSPAVPATRGL